MSDGSEQPMFRQPMYRMSIPRLMINMALWSMLPFLVYCLLPPHECGIEYNTEQQCKRNLRTIGMALLQYQYRHGGFPPAITTDAQGRPMHSWRVLILPYLDQIDIYRRYQFDEPWNGPNNRLLDSEMPSVFACPRSPAVGRNTTTHYVALVGPNTAFPQVNATTKLANIIAPASRSLVVEWDESNVHWMDPATWRSPGSLGRLARSQLGVGPASNIQVRP
jgi:hypothetical protein